jgi:hypothetical protein
MRGGDLRKFQMKVESEKKILKVDYEEKLRKKKN